MNPPRRAYGVFGLALALASIACGGSSASSSATDPDPSPPPASVAPTGSADAAETDAASLHHGVDVSVHSGTVDWHEVAAGGHTFAFAKATEGVDLHDAAFADNWAAMKAAGLVRGAYHFYVTEDDPDEQAAFFISKVDLETGDLAPVVDIELIGHGTQPGLADRLQRFVERLEAHYGIRPIIYTSPNFWNEHLDDRFGHHPLWVAEYEVDAPTIPEGWDTWHLWQWQGDASVPGVEKSADKSRVNRDGPDLDALIVR